MAPTLILGYASKPSGPGTLASFIGNLTHPYMKRSVSKSALGIPCYSEIKSAVSPTIITNHPNIITGWWFQPL